MREFHRSATLREGFALPVALLAMVVIGAVVTGGFYASSQESRLASSTDLGAQAFYVAEFGLGEVLGTWRNSVLDDVQSTASFGTTEARIDGQLLGTYTIDVRRLSPQLFLVTSEGRVQAGQRQASRRLASLVRSANAQMPYPSALSVFGGLSAEGNSQISGEDNGGPGCTAGDAVAGVTAVDDSLISEGNRERITGNPDVAIEPELDTTSLSQFGSIDLQGLIDAATHIYEAGESQNGMGPVTTVDAETGVELCDTSVRSNWGDPSDVGPCADHFPIIYGKGDLHLKTGVGQGILIVEGDLRATGNFDFYGVIVVKGSLFTSGTGNHLEGSVIVKGDGELDSESTTTGNSLVQYSRCRVERAFNASIRPRPLSKRPWADLSAATPAAAF